MNHPPGTTSTSTATSNDTPTRPTQVPVVARTTRRRRVYKGGGIHKSSAGVKRSPGSIKGNRKGTMKSYQVRRSILLALATSLLLVTFISFWTGSSSSKLRSTMTADAAKTTETEVSSSGRIVMSEEDGDSTPQQEDTAEDVINEEQQDKTTVMNNDLHSFPTLKYGTAWKKEQTAALVHQAVHAGFRHIDTACQPKHYNEPGVGIGWTKAAEELGLERKDIWIQTKFTNLDGQDPNTVPYDKTRDLESQVRQSLEISLKNLQTDYIDSLIMHGPERTWDLNLRVWAVLETFVDSGRVKQIGVSNAWDADFVKYLYSKARIKPKVVQQRFYGDTKYEVDMREFCQENNIEFQSFWTLGANRHIFQQRAVLDLASSKRLSPQTLLYAFCLAIGITPLDGTTSSEHMKEDIELLYRIKQGEKIFTNLEELSVVAEALGIPGWKERMNRIAE